MDNQPGCLSQATSVVGCYPVVNSHRQSVFLLHGEGKIGVVLMLQTPEVFLLVVREQPPSGSSVLPSIAMSLVENLVAKQEIVCVNFALLTKPFEPEFHFLLKLADQRPPDVAPFTLLRIASKVMNAVNGTFAELSSEGGDILWFVRCSAY